MLLLFVNLMQRTFKNCPTWSHWICNRQMKFKFLTKDRNVYIHWMYLVENIIDLRVIACTLNWYRATFQFDQISLRKTYLETDALDNMKLYKSIEFLRKRFGFFQIKSKRLPYKTTYLIAEWGGYLASQWLLFN